MEAQKFNHLLKSINKVRSFEILYDYFYRRIIFHLKYIYGESIAQEVAQEFFIGLINKQGEDFGYIEYPASWVYKCCENIAKRKLSKEVSAVELNDKLLLKYEQQFEIEVYGKLYDKIKKLDEESQKIIRMHYWEGYNFSEISKILCLKAVTVRQKHNRAIKKLGKYKLM